jgi:hypothetical protein
MMISHMCVELTISPLGRFMVSGSIAEWMLVMGVPVITKMDVAPVSAMACVLANASTLGMPFRSAEAMSVARDLLVYWGPKHQLRYHDYIYDYLPAPPHTVRSSEAASCVSP